jgi:hypothetical protein
MTKVDFKKELKHLYQASAKATATVDVPPLRYLMIDCQGNPNTTAAHAQAIEALFAVSYACKFAVKKGPLAIDYAVMPLEGLWWADDMSVFATDMRDAHMDAWQWTMMVMQPDCVSDDLVLACLQDTKQKKKDLPALDMLRLERFTEGLCAQLLHIGPFSDEGPNIARLHADIEQHGSLRGKHHEIYLSDIRRAAPAKWKTILRQPMQRHAS